MKTVISTETKKDYAAQRGRDAFGTATRISASLSRRPSAFFESAPGQDPKAAQFAVLIPGPGMFVNVRNAPRVVIAPPSEIPLFRPVSRCVRSFSESRVCVPIFVFESERGPFLGEVKNRDEKRLGTELRWHLRRLFLFCRW